MSKSSAIQHSSTQSATKINVQTTAGTIQAHAPKKSTIEELNEPRRFSSKESPLFDIACPSRELRYVPGSQPVPFLESRRA
jgi:hypothetical protein